MTWLIILFLFILLIMLMGISYLFLLASRLTTPEKAKEFSHLVILHRAYCDEYPEQTLEAIQYVLDQGIKALEVDVMLSKDNHLIVYHDEKMNRLNHLNSSITELTLTEIKQSPIIYNNKTYNIATLEEVIQLIIRYDIKLEIDFKNSRRRHIKAELIANLFKQYNLYNNVYVSSFYPSILYSVRRNDPKIITAFAIAEKGFENRIINQIYHILALYYFPKILKSSIVEIEQGLISTNLIDYWQTRDKTIVGWNINDERLKHNLEELGISYVSDSID